MPSVAMKKIIDHLRIDWYLFVPALLISLAGLVTMNSFSAEDYFFSRQRIWIIISLVVFLCASAVDWRFLRRTSVVLPIFLGTVFALLLLFIIGHTAKGAERWFNLGFVAFQPSDLAKLAIISILAKYFSRRHIEIKVLRHIVVSGLYTLILFLPVFLQPDLSSAVVIFGIWLGMVLISGISKKHLAWVILLGLVTSAVMWTSVLAPYQKARITSFLHPLSDIRGAGYNAYQSTIAIGSGELIGKGIGQGSQSKLKFLPEYQTDFIFAAFTEEWGFVGAVALLALFLFLLIRIVENASKAPTNFEAFFSIGVAIFILLHVIIHVGMNSGVLPVTGITLPFMSYGGSHLLVEWLALGIISSMTRYSKEARI
jgi:rod shape determining protein RodA